MKSLFLVLTAIAATLVACGGTDSSGGGDASCAKLLVLDGREYGALGGLDRIPMTGKRIGTGTAPGCDDGNGAAESYDVELWAIEGIDPDVALLGDDGSVWLPSDATTPAPEVAELRRTLPCSLSPGAEVLGQIVAVPGGWTLAQDGVPYVARLRATRADNGSAPWLDGYAEVTVPVRVSEETAGGADADTLHSSLGEGQLVTVGVGCDRRRYVATSIALAD